MEIIQKEKRPTRELTLAERISGLEKKTKFQEKQIESKRKTRGFKWPMKWKMKFNKSGKANMREMMLVIFLNKKNEMEVPRFMPIFEGNMIVYKNKPYEFDPRAIWTIKGVKKNPRAYLIKEIDRRPVRNKDNRIVFTDAAVSNMDIDEIRRRGDSTESDEFLIKAALRAQLASVNKKKISTGVLIAIGVIVVGAIIYFLSKGGGA